MADDITTLSAAHGPSYLVNTMMNGVNKTSLLSAIKPYMVINMDTAIKTTKTNRINPIKT